MIDFYENGEVDPILILEQYKTYYTFLREVEPSYKDRKFTEQEELTLDYISKILAHGKRPHELEILKEIVENGKVNKCIVRQHLTKQYNIEVDEISVEVAFSTLQGTFVTNKTELERYICIDLMKENKEGFYERMLSFQKRLNNLEFKKQLTDVLKLGIRRYEDIYNDPIQRRGAFVLYEKYSRRDVCHLLNWRKDLSSTMYGMKRIGNDVVIFVTYHKGEAGEEKEYLEGKPNYADEFINNQVFMWDSQIGKGLNSSYMKDLQQAIYKHLFIKKSDAEGTDFYYMGQFDILQTRADKKKDNKGRWKDISKVKIQMHDPVREDLLQYLKQG